MYFNALVIGTTVVDGDTVKATIDLGWRIKLDIQCRLDGIDAPERVTLAGKLVKQAVIDWFEANKTYQMILLSKELDLYGRTISDFVVRGLNSVSLTRYLLDKKLAKAYDGKSKRLPWSFAELTFIEETLRRK